MPHGDLSRNGNAWNNRKMIRDENRRLSVMVGGKKKESLNDDAQ